MTNCIEDILVKFFNEAAKDLNADDLKDGVLITKSHTKAKAQLQTLVEQMMSEVIGEDEPEYSNLNGDAGYWEIYGRNQLRAEQRQRIHTIVAQYFGGEK